MRISPARPQHRRPPPFTDSSDLSATILRMIAFNSLAAFSQSLTRGEPAASVSAVSPGRGAGVEQAAPAQRRMAEPRGVEAGGGATSPQAGTPPRGSLLDLRV